MKRIHFCVVAVFLVFLGSLYGCATPDKPLAVREMPKASVIKVVRYDSPQLLKKTAGSKAIALTGVMFGALGGGLGGAISAGLEASAGNELAQRCNLPDFGKLVTDRFVEKVQEDLPEWPELSVEDKPTKEEPKSDSGYLLVVRVTLVMVESGSGLTTSTTAQMFDPANQVVWQKRFSYKSRDFGRCTALDDLEAENGELLHREFQFAAERTVSSFIHHLNVPPSA